MVSGSILDPGQLTVGAILSVAVAVLWKKNNDLSKEHKEDIKDLNEAFESRVKGMLSDAANERTNLRDSYKEMLMAEQENNKEIVNQIVAANRENNIEVERRTASITKFFQGHIEQMYKKVFETSQEPKQ